MPTPRISPIGSGKRRSISERHAQFQHQKRRHGLFLLSDVAKRMDGQASAALASVPRCWAGRASQDPKRETETDEELRSDRIVQIHPWHCRGDYRLSRRRGLLHHRQLAVRRPGNRSVLHAPHLHQPGRCKPRQAESRFRGGEDPLRHGGRYPRFRAPDEGAVDGIALWPLPE